MVKFEKRWTVYTRGGENAILKEFVRFKKGTGVPSRIVKLKKPIGKHTHAIEYRKLKNA